MSGLFRAEVIKLARRKLFWILTIVLGAVTGLTGFLFLVLPRVLDPASLEGMPTIARPEAYLFGVQQLMGQTWFPIILASVPLASELAGATWAASLTRDARRGLHMAARLVVWLAAAWLAMLAATAMWATGTAVLAGGEGGPTATEWLGVIWKVALVQLAWVSMGVAAAALFRSVGVAVGVALAFSFVEGPLAFWRPYRSISLSQAASDLFSVEILGGIGIGFAGSVGSTANGAAVIAVWATVSLILAWWTLTFRDA